MKVVTYFMSSEDANHFLNEMAQVMMMMYSDDDGNDEDGDEDGCND